MTRLVTRRTLLIAAYAATVPAVMTWLDTWWLAPPPQSGRALFYGYRAEELEVDGFACLVTQTWPEHGGAYHLLVAAIPPPATPLTGPWS